jgi:hypothetical protein
LEEALNLSSDIILNDDEATSIPDCSLLRLHRL